MLQPKIEPWGFVVIEAGGDYEQILSIDVGEDKPTGGVLCWAGNSRTPRVFFPTRKMAREAINRTEHYRRAFGDTRMPMREFCRVEMIAAVQPAPSPTAESEES